MTTENTSERPSDSFETPLVSIICRTTHRPELAEALRSVAAQTYPRIELIVVNAVGEGEVVLPGEVAGQHVQVVNRNVPLARPAAANAGLDAASGDYLIFLDEDDWIAPDHIEGLVQALSTSEALAAYSNTQKTDVEGELLQDVFARDYDPALLMRENFLPIHSVLFSRVVIDKGCRFDERLDIYEDWDFWLQVSQFTHFIHCDVTTAFYREGGESETALSDPMLRYQPGHPNAVAREKVLDKWVMHWQGSDVNRMLATLDQTDEINELLGNVHALHRDKQIQRSEIEQLQSQVHTSAKELDGVRSQLEQTEAQLGLTTEELVKLAERHDELISSHKDVVRQRAQLQQRQQALEIQHDRLQQQHEALNRGVQELLNSFSWRITRPYRFLSSRVKRHLIVPLKERFSSVSQEIPVAEQAKISEQSNETAPVKRVISKERLLVHIDSPSAQHSLFSEMLVLQGWALAPSGAVDIVVSIDGLDYFHFSPSIARPDVMRLHPKLAHAATCGFFERLSLRYLASGQHKLRLKVTSPSGVVENVDSSFLLYRNDELYNAWLSVQNDKFADEAASMNSDVPTAVLQVVVESSTSNEADTTCVQSLLAQKGIGLQLHYIGKNWSEVVELLQSRSNAKLPDSVHIYGDRADALSKAAEQSGWLVLIDKACVLSPHALKRMLGFAIEQQAELIYSDHDVLVAGDTHESPVFTFSWSPEHLISHNYIGDCVLVNSELVSRYTHLAIGDSWIYRFLLQLTIEPQRIGRVAEVLWSCNKALDSASEAVRAAEIEAIHDFLSSNKIAAELQLENHSRYLRWEYPDASHAPKISIIIPTMGKLQLVRPCLDSLQCVTDYPDFEVIILDNSRGQNPDGISWLKDQGFKVLECNEPFNWARLNNKGAEIASGELLLFLNDDIEIRQADWLHALARQAIRPEIGAVGCKLLYPNGALQHAGVFLVNYGGGGLHLFHKMPADQHIYQRLDLRVRETSAVTGACLMVRRAEFDTLGGFDEELAVVGNDVDFCLRLLKRGKRNLWTPHCTLIHHESISRESTVPPEDEKAMWRRWGDWFQQGDRYYNPNLSLTKWDCSQDFNVDADKLLERLPVAVVDETRSPLEKLQNGVNLIGYIRADMGLGEGARSDARALTAAGIDFGIINFETGNPSSMTNELWRHKEILNAPFDINLIHINGDFLPTVVAELPAHFLMGRYNIAYWAWELEELPDHWLPSLQFVDEIWVPSDFVKAAVEKVCDLPVITIPHNVDVLPCATFGRAHFKIPENTFTFLAMYDTRSIAERKNPGAALESFKKAFAKDDHSVCLVLKLNNATEDAVAELQTLIKGYTNIVILDKRHSRQEVDALLTQIDCFVSLHRSEGFGLGPTEAMSLGKPCILTNWSGNTDYMTDENCLAVDYQLITIDQDYGPYNAGQRWADADVEQAARYMHELANDKERALKIGLNAKASIEAGFSPMAVGKLMQQRLDEIRNAVKASL